MPTRRLEVVSMTDDLRLTRAPVSTKGMLVRKPPAEVFAAFADPAITTRFWFTRSSGKVVAGARLKWDWEMFGASVDVVVKDVEQDRRIVFEWGAAEAPRTVELRFVPHQGHAYVNVTETGFSGTGDQMAAQAIDSASGFALVLAALKALLEHDLVLAVVADHVVPDLELS
jgi:uncharacterized protein YndB with AHSA1/START domain